VNDNSEGIKEALKVIGVMFVTALDMLREAGLLGPESPLPDNVGIMTLLFLEFVTQTCDNFHLEWVHEVVRAADACHVVLTPQEQVHIGQDKLDELRQVCGKKKAMKGFAWKSEVRYDSICGLDLMLTLCVTVHTVRVRMEPPRGHRV
jgi:hypothetical protein